MITKKKDFRENQIVYFRKFLGYFDEKSREYDILSGGIRQIESSGRS